MFYIGHYPHTQIFKTAYDVIDNFMFSRLSVLSDTRMQYNQSQTLNKESKQNLEVTEMWFLRRKLRIPWATKKTII